MNYQQTFKAGVCALVASGFFAPSLYAKDEPEIIRLQPSSQWNVNFDDDSCRLARFFGEGDLKTLFYIERYEPGDRFTMVAAGEPMKDRRNRGEIAVQFGSAFDARKTGYTIGTVGEFSPALIFGSLRFDMEELSGSDVTGDDADSEPAESPNLFEQGITAEAEAGINWIAFTHRRGKQVYLETGSLADPMKVMRNCTDDMLRYWGIDLEKHRTIATMPQPKESPGKWLGPRDYPTKLLIGGYQGYVQVRLSVDETGKPSACHIQQSTRPEGFDSAVCEGLMRRARFEPAKTVEGESIASYWRTAVRFEMPR